MEGIIQLPRLFILQSHLYRVVDVLSRLQFTQLQSHLVGYVLYFGQSGQLRDFYISNTVHADTIIARRFMIRNEFLRRMLKACAQRSRNLLYSSELGPPNTYWNSDVNKTGDRSKYFQQMYIFEYPF